MQTKCVKIANQKWRSNHNLFFRYLGGKMKKSIVFIFTIFMMFSVFAGDVASFVDLGFTDDGKYYIFGQYGKIDKKFQGWAEIYQVDIEKNDYVDGGVFSIKPSSVTNDKNGKDVYESLEAKSYYYLKDYKTTPADADHTLYILDDTSKKGTDEIVFTDFKGSEIENPDKFYVKLVPTVYGSGKNLKSSFYINLEKKDANGNVIFTKKVGSPNIKRKNVSDYKIERIFSDKTESSLIFVIEKTLQDDSGVSIRYMVEAIKL